MCIRDRIRRSWPSLSRSPAPTRPGPIPGYRQRRRPQTRRDPGLAYGEPSHPRALHPNLRVGAEPCRGLVRHHRTNAKPSCAVPSDPCPSGTPSSAPSSTAGTTADARSRGPRQPPTSSRRPTARTLQTRTTSTRLADRTPKSVFSSNVESPRPRGRRRCASTLAAMRVTSLGPTPAWREPLA